MSDTYEAVAVLGVESEKSAALSEVVVSRLVAEGIVHSSLDPEAVLGGDGGYRPGTNIPALYQRSGSEGTFWSLLTNGMEVCVGPWVNQLAFMWFDGFTCPACSAHFPRDYDEVADPFAKAIGSFLDNKHDLDVTCPSCKKTNAVPDWKTDPHFGYTNLAFQFWNWPPLDTDSWAVDIPRLIASASGHDVLLTCGRL